MKKKLVKKLVKKLKKMYYLKFKIKKRKNEIDK